jgi:hypothetical protein
VNIQIYVKGNTLRDARYVLRPPLDLMAEQEPSRVTKNLRGLHDSTHHPYSSFNTPSSTSDLSPR